MPVMTSERDVIAEIQDLDDDERIATYHRWVELSKLVAPEEEPPDPDR